MGDTVVDVFIAACVLGGATLLLVSALAMFRAKDALSRINVFSPATGMGMPLVLVGCYTYTLQHEGFSVYRLLIAIVGFFALIIVSSIASNTLSRSTVLSGSPVHRYTRPNRLAHAQGEDPREDWDADEEADSGEESGPGVESEPGGGTMDDSAGHAGPTA